MQNCQLLKTILIYSSLNECVLFSQCKTLADYVYNRSQYHKINVHSGSIILCNMSVIVTNIISDKARTNLYVLGPQVLVLKP